MFHINIGHSRHRSEIFAQIDYNGPNWRYLTLKMTFGVDPHISYFKIGLVSHQRRYHGAIHLSSTSLLLNNINNSGKIMIVMGLPTIQMIRQGTISSFQHSHIKLHT